jgi:hypothetical protein
MKDEKLTFIFCAPLSKFPEQPKDYSSSCLVDCPMCKEKMWLSSKKREMILISNKANRKLIMYCFDCFEKEFKKHPEWINHIGVKI